MSNDRFKFRVWLAGETCVDHKHPDQAYINCATGEAVYYNGFAGCMLDLDKYVIEQCTGLKDKNGKLIYEGDLLRTPSGWSGDYPETQKVQAVEWCPDYDDVGFFVSFPDGIGYKDCEVIGNRWETPELLEA